APSPWTAWCALAGWTHQDRRPPPEPPEKKQAAGSCPPLAHKPEAPAKEERVVSFPCASGLYFAFSVTRGPFVFPMVLDRQIQLTILELRFVLLGRAVTPRNDLRVAQVLGQVLTLLARQLQQVALVRPDAPLIVVLAGGRGLVQVLAAGPPE